MTEYEGLYTAVVASGPKEIERNLSKIPGIHQQEALDNALEKSVSLSVNPSVQNVKYLLKLGADPNGPSGEEGTVISYAYSSGLEHIVELLLQAGADLNAPHSNVLEQAVRKGDDKYVVRFVEAGADIHDKTKLLFTDDLLVAAKDYPEIQQYLISKGLDAGTDLKKKLVNVKTLQLSDFDYPDPGYKPRANHNVPNSDDVPQSMIEIQDYSSKYFIVRGDTKHHQNLLRRNGGRFIAKLKGGKGWLLPVSRRAIIQAEIEHMSNIPTTVSPTPTPSQTESPTPTPTASPDEIDPALKNLLSSNSISRPVIKKHNVIDLYTPIGEYGFMTVSFTRPNMYYLDNNYWDSIERYLMYKMYEGSFKATAIKNAETLDIARKKFNVTTVPIAKTPKQLVLNQKLQPLAHSKINKNYLQHREQLFYLANKAKFSQNKLYRNKLLNTGDLEIINKNFHDYFGYEGNLLGNTLLKLREEFGGAEYDQRNIKKTNSLVIERYPGNKNFYVIRGDPDQDLAAEIRSIGTFRTKAGKVIRGKLNLNLQGGAGWLIPISKSQEAKKLVFDTYPDERKIEVSGCEWVKNRMKKLVEIAILFSRFRGRTEVGPDDLMFSIKDVFGSEDFSGEEIPADNFIRSVWKYADTQDAVMSDSAIQLLWNFLSKMVLEFTHGIETYSQMKDIMNKIEASILDIPIKQLEGLSERESIIVSSFNRLFKLLKKINNSETKICVTVVHMMLGKQHYEQIREIYSKKTKMQGDSDYPDDETQFRRRFNIKNPHIQAVLDNLPKDTSKKCKLLVLTTLDYIMDLEGEDAININNRLILLSQKGTQPSPTPKTPTPKSPTPEINESELTTDIPSDSPPFEGTPVEEDPE